MQHAQHVGFSLCARQAQGSRQIIVVHPHMPLIMHRVLGEEEGAELSGEEEEGGPKPMASICETNGKSHYR